MTIASEVSRIAYTGSGITGPFTVPFYFLANSDLKVVRTTIADGTEYTMILTTDYTVSGAGNPSGGSITLVVALSSSYRLTIIRNPNILQGVDYTENDKFPAETHEGALDRLTTVAQRLYDLFTRTFRLSDGDLSGISTEMPTVPVRANKFLAFNASGIPIASSGTGADAGLRDDLADTGTPGNSASLIGFKQTGAGATGRNVLTKLQESISVKDFGAVGDGATDDTAAFTAAAAALNTAGGGMLLIPEGTYKVLSPVSGVMCTFADVNGITIQGAGAIIDDQTSYSGSQVSTLFKFTACKNVFVSRGLRVQTQRLGISYSDAFGLTSFSFHQGCEGIDIDYEQDGGKEGVLFTKAAGDPASYISRQIRVRTKVNRCHYPYVSQFSGDGADVDIDATDCGRNFFLYGSAQNRIKVRSKNQKVTSLIKAYSGYGCSDISVEYYDRDSDSCNAAAPVMELSWGDSTVATHRNIDLMVNLKNPSGAPWGNSITFSKYSDGGTTPDAVGRGHVLDGYRLSGISDNTGTAKSHVATTAGGFASTDVFRNIAVENLTLLGSSEAATFPLTVLADEAVFKNVRSQHNIYTGNTTNGKAVFIGCRALNFVSAASNTDTHDYISSNIVTGTNDGTATNKTYINTYVNSVLRSRLLGSHGATAYKTGTITLRAVKSLSGDLTGVNNIFFISPALGTGAYFRLKYFLVADQADTNPASRDETSGIKSFSATMNASGTWVAQLAVANDVTERTQGTASVITVSLVNGTSAGAHIAVACTNYNGANAVGRFECEMISMSNSAAIELSAA